MCAAFPDGILERVAVLNGSARQYRGADYDYA
jgi:hypothetical protein